MFDRLIAVTIGTGIHSAMVYSGFADRGSKYHAHDESPYSGYGDIVGNRC